jgi:hypothetical protein
MISYLLASPPISYMHFSSSIRVICHVHLIPLYLIILIILAKGTNYEAPHYAVFSNLLSLHLSVVQIHSPQHPLLKFRHSLCSCLNLHIIHPVVIRKIYNGTVYTTIFLKEIKQTLLCQYLFLLSVGGNATCFDPFLGSSTGTRSWIASLVNMNSYCVCMNFYTNKYILI